MCIRDSLHVSRGWRLSIVTANDSHPEQFPLKPIAVDEDLHYGDGRLDQDSMLTANHSHAVILAESLPEDYRLTGANH